MMNFNFKNYKKYFFDCDGVLIDSNRIKTDAFFDVGKLFGNKDQAEALKLFHVAHGGVSRFKKFDFFFNEILKLVTYESELKTALDEYSKLTMARLLDCKVIDGAFEFIEKIPHDKKKYVVTGSSHDDVQILFKKRNWLKFFNGVYGSPSNKYEIINNIGETVESIYWGDSLLDYEVAIHFGMHFVFVSKTTEFKDYKKFFIDKNVSTISDFSLYKV